MSSPSAGSRVVGGDSGRRVRLWFGPHLLGEYAADADTAQTYADVMAFQFHGLRVTVGYPESGQVLESLPPRRLWPLTVG